MKKIIALLLVLCVCLAMFVACQAPDTPDDPNPPSGETPGGGNEGGETPGGGNEGGDETTALRGEPITAERWAAMTSTSGYRPENYTFVTVMQLPSGQRSEATVWVDGDEFKVEAIAGEKEKIFAGFKIDGVLGDYQYDTETGKWKKLASNPDAKDALTFPLTGINVPFTNLIYDEETGSYSYEETFEMSGFGNVVASFEAYFQNGNLVSYRYQEAYQSGNVVEEWRAGDYGTTVLQRPAAEDIVSDEGGDNAGGDVSALYYPITEAQFEALKSNPPTNYSYIEYRVYNGETVRIERMIDGECFMDSQYDGNGNLTRRWCRVKVGDRYVDYGYDIATGKWQEHNSSISSNYPLAGFPYELSAFTYDSERSTYDMTMGSATLSMGFDENGMLVYLGQIGGENTDEIDLYDYGTTVIEVPAAEDMIPGHKDESSSGSGVSTGH